MLVNAAFGLFLTQIRHTQLLLLLVWLKMSPIHDNAAPTLDQSREHTICQSIHIDGSIEWKCGRILAVYLMWHMVMVWLVRSSIWSLQLRVHII